MNGIMIASSPNLSVKMPCINFSIAEIFCFWKVSLSPSALSSVLDGINWERLGLIRSDLFPPGADNCRTRSSLGRLAHEFEELVSKQTTSPSLASTLASYKSIHSDFGFLWKTMAEGKDGPGLLLKDLWRKASDFNLDASAMLSEQ
jgi:hypothetical protein